jgi:hypothetical protein
LWRYSDDEIALAYTNNGDRGRPGKGLSPEHLETRPVGYTDTLRVSTSLPAPRKARQGPDEEEHHAQRQQGAAKKQRESHLIECSVNDLGDAHAILVVDLDNFAPGNYYLVVCDDVDRRADLAVELDHLTDPELEH